MPAAKLSFAQCDKIALRLHERMPMIARHWRGWTEVRNADAYESLLKSRVLPELKRVAGYRGGYVLRSEGTEEVEFVVVNLFDSIESVRLFAGADYSTPVFEPEARLLLSRVEPTARHYEVRASTVQIGHQEADIGF
jgi:hypothetical protein